MKVNNNRDMILCRIGVNLISQNYLCRPHSGQFAFIQSKIEIWNRLFLLFDTVIRLHIKRLRLASVFEHFDTHKQTSNFAINKYINFQVVSVIQTQIQHTNSNRVVFGSNFFHFGQVFASVPLKCSSSSKINQDPHLFQQLTTGQTNCLILQLHFDYLLTFSI